MSNTSPHPHQSTTSSTTTLTIPSTQVITLIQNYLLENGLQQSFTTLQNETQIKSHGLLQHLHTSLVNYVNDGSWGQVLDILSTLTLDRDGDGGDGGDCTVTSTRNYNEVLLANVHEMAILELGELGEMELAFATLKLCRDLLDSVQGNVDDDNDNNNNNHIHDDSNKMLLSTMKNTLGDKVERKLHALNALRTTIHSTTTGTNVPKINNTLPPDYYGPNNISKEKRRADIANKLDYIIPIIPQNRLLSLLQQSIKWQIYTGSMPSIQDKWMIEDHHNHTNNHDEGGKKGGKKKYKSKRKFDLVFGTIDDDKFNTSTNSSTSTKMSSSSSSKKSSIYEKIPLDPYSVIKLSKNTIVTSATFYNDLLNQKISIITGSSDGFVEIWDDEFKYTKLRMDLDYQKNDEFMCHYDDDDDDKCDKKEKGGDNHNDDKNKRMPSILALTINSNGTMLASGDDLGSINIWNLQKGTCLRSFDKVHGGAVTCLDFSKDGEESSRIISGSQDGSCREFGLRTSRMLKELRGHSSFVNCCHYVLSSSIGGSDDKLLIVTGSADGTVRIWDGKTAEILRVLNPVVATGPSAVLTISQESGVTTDSNIHTVIHLHTPTNSMIVIPRGPKAYLITYSGVIVRTFHNDVSLMKDEKKSSTIHDDFVAGAVSPSNKWLYAVTCGGLCICFDLASGKVEKLIRDFGIESTGGKINYEITGVVHHPHKGMLGAFSSSSSLKRGLLTIWK